MRHAISILAIIAVVGVATLLFSVDLISQPTPAAVTLRPSDQQAGNTVVVNLDVNELIGNEAQTLTEYQLNHLRRGTVHGREGRTDYSQQLVFYDPAMFQGGRIVFGRTDQGEVTDFLEFPDSVFKLKLEFEQGLRSKVEGGELVDIENEDIEIMGSQFVIVDTDVNVDTGRVSIKLFGGFGSIEFTDNNARDDQFQRGVKINGKSIDADVRIRAQGNENEFTIYSIQYVLHANAAASGELQVVPLHCVREFLQYPGGMLVPHFDICYKGLGADAVLEQPIGGPPVAGNGIFVRALGDDEYAITATNTHGRQYKIPLAQLPGQYGNKDRNLVFVEAGGPGAPNIELGDYILVNSRDAIQGVSNVIRYDSNDGSTAYFTDLAGDTRSATFNPDTGEGQLLLGEGTYRFVVGADQKLAMDQTNDGQINGGEAVFVVMGGPKLDLGPGFTVRLIVPQRLFDEPMGDEVTKFDVLFNGQVDLFVPSPQGDMELQSLRGRKQGLTRYGVFIDWDTDSDSDDLTLTIPGASGARRSVTKGSAFGEVFISLERQKLMKYPQKQVPAPVKCGDSIITRPEYCDPPGSLCTRPGVPKGECAADCMSCKAPKGAVCGNNKIDPGEQCEKSADCAANEVCNACKCQPKPAPVCGNNLIEPPEMCEKNIDCAPGQVCAGCNCVTPVKKTVNCQYSGECRIWDNSCGGNGMELLMEDGVAKGCVDAREYAAKGVDYCGKFAVARGSRDCNYQDSRTKQHCICPRGPELQQPAQVAVPNVFTRIWWAIQDFFKPTSIPMTKKAVGEVCDHGGECQTGNCIYAGGEGPDRTYKCSCDPFKLTSVGC